MKLDTLLSLLAATFVALALAVGGWILSGDGTRLVSDAEHREIRVTSEVLTTAIDQASTLSLTHAESVAADPEVRRLMVAGDRAGLLAHVKPLFQRLGATGGVNVLHFHDAAMKSFLRVWEPENFGQDLSKFRPMVIAVNHNRKPAKGLEFGVKGLSLRAIAPIEDGGRLIGTVEAGVDLGALTELAKAATGSDFAIFLDPASVNAPGNKEGSLTVEAATDSAFFKDLQASGHIHLSREQSFETAERNGRTFGVMGRPLLDYSGNMIGTIVVTCDFTELEGHVARSTVTLMAVLLCGFIVTFAAFMIGVRAMILRPLEALAAWCRGDGDEQAPPPGSDIREFRTLYDAAISLKADRRGH